MIAHHLFAPISINEYTRLHMKSNPGENKESLEKRLRGALAYSISGGKCSCGDDIWVIGSAQAGYSCFTCITGEDGPDNDYEIDQHLDHIKKTMQKE